jgi:hypothetical protein
MQETLIVRSQEELETALSRIIGGISGAIQTAKGVGGAGSHVLPPQDLQITGMMILELSAEEIIDTTTTPANTVTTTSTTPATTVTSTDQVGAKTETTTQTPPNRTTSRLENGGDVEDTDITYENIT